MNRFSYYITIYFIPSNKDYNFYRNSHSVFFVLKEKCTILSVLKNEYIK